MQLQDTKKNVTTMENIFLYEKINRYGLFMVNILC